MRASLETIETMQSKVDAVKQAGTRAFNRRSFGVLAVELSILAVAGEL